MIGIEPHNPSVDADFAVPMFVHSIARSAPGNSSPYLRSREDLRAEFADDPLRGELLDSLEWNRHRLAASGIHTCGMLLGGSFLQRRKVARDLDALVFYRLADTAASDVALQVLAAAPSDRRLDLRFCPVDAGWEVLVKTSCFFHALYAQNKVGGAGDRGCLLVTFVPEPATPPMAT